MSRCYPFPPPGYEKKAPQLSADIAQPHKDKKDRHKHKDKKKKKKKDGGDANGDTHDNRPSKQPRTALVNDLLQPRETKTQQNGKVRDAATAVTEHSPLITTQSTTTGVEPSLVGRDHGGTDTSAQSASERTTPVNPKPVAAVVVVPSPPLYSTQEPNGKADDAKPVNLVLPPESVSGSEPSSRPDNSSAIIIINQPSNNSDPQRQSPKASELPVAADAADAADCAMLALKPPSAWSDVPDEDWLFAGRRSLGSHPKPKAEVERGASSRGEPSLQVWAEAVFLPSCDLYALPYVVPY